jgi:hypothetical protein
MRTARPVQINENGIRNGQGKTRPDAFQDFQFRHQRFGHLGRARKAKDQFTVDEQNFVELPVRIMQTHIFDHQIRVARTDTGQILFLLG